VNQLFEDSQPEPPGPADGLVLHYTFDTHDGVTVPDESCTGNDGVVRGTAPCADGALYGAYAFDGIDDRVSCGLDPSLQITGDLTYTVWFRRTESGHAILIGRRNGDDAYHIGSHLSLNPFGGAVIGICSGRWELGQYVATEGVDLNDGRWHHLAGVYEAGKALRIYVDGALNAEKTNGIFASLSSRLLPVYVGARENAYFFNGAMDDARIYSRALNPAEIAALYNATAVDKVKVVVTGDPGAYGMPTPLGYGTNWIPSGETVSTAVASPSPGDPGVRHLCSGWLGIGDVPVSGSTNTVTFTPSQTSTLTWIWETEYQLVVSATGGGTVDIPDAWYPTGTVAAIAPIPEPGYAFDGWAGNVPAGHEMDDPLSVVMDQPRFITATFYPSNLAAGLELHYTFDDFDGVTLTDVSGNGRHGTVHGATQTPYGVLDAAYAFDGIDDYVSAGTMSMTSGSVSVWIRPGTIKRGENVVFGVVQGNNDRYWKAGVYTNGLYFGYRTSVGNHRFCRAEGEYPLEGQWHHFAATFDASTLTPHLYLDGRELPFTTDAVGTPAGTGVTQPAAVGRDGGWNGYYYNGLVDDLRVYDRALRSNEVAELCEVVGPGRVELVVEVGEGGTVDPGSGLFEEGAEVELTAFPSNGYAFVAWQGDVPPGSQFSNPVTVVMDGPRTVRALFWNRTHMLGLHWNESGSYFPGENTINCRFYVPDVDELMSLVWTPDLPGDWALVDAEGDGGPSVLGNEIVFTRHHVREPVEFSYTVAVPAGTTAPQSVGGVATYQIPGMSNPEDVTVLPDPLVLRMHDRDFHSADYQEDRWAIDARELSRVLFYWRAGWYRPDPEGYDGYTGITEPYADASNELHSADYHPPHWRIGVDEANRVLAYWRAGGYRIDPSGRDGYAPAKGVPGIESLPQAAPPASESTGPAESPPERDGWRDPLVAALGETPSAGYDPGGTVVITNVVAFDSELLALCIKPELPPGWTILDVTAEGSPEVAHDEILWTGSLPASPVTVVYTIRVPATCRGTRQVLSHVEAYVSSSANPTNAPASAAQFAMDARDADGDGLPDGWEETYVDGSISLDPNIDNDGDGMDNRQEWIAGTDPTDAGSVLALTGVVRIEDGKLLLIWQSALDRRYHIMAADNAVEVFTPLRTNLLSTPPANSADVQMSGRQQGLLRVGVQD